MKPVMFCSAAWIGLALSGCAIQEKFFTVRRPPADIAKVQPMPQETFRGKASFYGRRFHGRRTANGERFNQFGLTAAHRSLPFGSVVLVRNLRNNRSVKVRINDRGPYIDGRIIDLSRGAAARLDMLRSGIVEVEVTVLKSP